MSNKLKILLSNPYNLLLFFLILAGYAGNYFSYPFGFGVDFLFGSIAVLTVIYLYGIWWGTLASLLASSYTIILWQHPYALIIFVCEALFVGWRIRKGKKNLVTSDMAFWVCIGIPLVLIFYGYILKVGVVTTAIIALKQPVNGIFNSLIASFLLYSKPLYRWANTPPQKTKVFFEQILLNLLVASVLIPALILMVANNQVALKHEQDALITTLEISAHNLATDLKRWHQSGLDSLNFLAQTSSQSRIVVSGQTQHSLELIADHFPLFKNVYIINADRKVIAEALTPQKSISKQINFTQLELPRIPQIFVQSTKDSDENEAKPKILQTVPIILNNRWLGNIVAELNVDFIEQILDTEDYSFPLRSTLRDQNQLLIARIDKGLNEQQEFDLSNREVNEVKSTTTNHSVSHSLPIIEGKPLIARWRESFYIEKLTIDEEIPLVLNIKAPASPYIDFLQLLYIRSLAVLLAIALASILIAKYLSRILVKPILKLAIFTTNLPNKILLNEKIELPKSSVIETNALVSNFEAMSQTIEDNIGQIRLNNHKLKQAKHRAEVANKAKDKFLANISHELKTPLNSIIGYSTLVQKTLKSDHEYPKNLCSAKSVERLANVQQDGKYLLALINEILDLAKSKAHKTKLNPSLVDFSSFMENIVVDSRVKAANKGISFKFETKGNLPTNIYADGPRLKRVLLNLLDNAVKFTDQGQIVLRVDEINPKEINNKFDDPKILQQNVLDTDTRYLRFKISDTGIGIEKQNLTKIFQPFEQVDKYEVSEVGMGLGLSISKQFVELMGGKINIKSEPEKGSLFWFDLKCPEIKVSSMIETQSVKEIVGYKGDSRTLLIIDDVKTSLMLLIDILKPLGFNIVTAKNGQQGLQVALNKKPDLILTDLFMPIKTGFTLISELRLDNSFVSTPIIAVSASSFEEVEKQSSYSGCSAFLEKPIDDRKLLKLLGKHLNLEWIYKS